MNRTGILSATPAGLDVDGRLKARGARESLISLICSRDRLVLKI